MPVDGQVQQCAEANLALAWHHVIRLVHAPTLALPMGLLARRGSSILPEGALQRADSAPAYPRAGAPASGHDPASQRSSSAVRAVTAARSVNLHESPGPPGPHVHEPQRGPVSLRSLVLNATFEPLAVVSARRALILVLSEKAQLLHAGEHVYRSERLAVAHPSVVRLSRYVRIPHGSRLALNRRTVFARDGYKCQYCGGAAESIDHVVPRSRGGAHEWENVVAACRRCNARKENRLPAEAGMLLAKAPAAPDTAVRLLASLAGIRADWQPYLDATARSA